MAVKIRVGLDNVVKYLTDSVPAGQCLPTIRRKNSYDWHGTRYHGVRSTVPRCQKQGHEAPSHLICTQSVNVCI